MYYILSVHNAILFDLAVYAQFYVNHGGYAVIALQSVPGSFHCYRIFIGLIPPPCEMDFPLTSSHPESYLKR